MHELSIASSLRDQVLEHLPAGLKLRSVTIEVGSLEHLDDAVMQVAWEVLSDEPPLEGSTLNMLHVPVLVRCRACDHEYSPEHQAALQCPDCGKAQPEILAGWGIVLKSLETGPSTNGHANHEIAPSP